MANEQRRKDMAKLRRRMDGDDSFMSAHQIRKMRTRTRVIPEWALSDKEVQKVLLRSFPDLHRNPRMKAQAGRWARVIHLYYRVQMPINQVANEMGITKNAAKMMLKGIRRVFKGRRFDNRAVRSTRGAGRPKSK